MPVKDFGVSSELAKRLFPFHFFVNRNLVLLQVGSGLTRLLPSEPEGRPLSELFTMVSPPIEPTYEDLCRTPSELFVLESSVERSFGIRGGFSEVGDGVLLFLGSLALRSTREVAELGLKFRDFPVHDPTLSSLSSLQVQTSALEDARRLVTERKAVEDALRVSEARLRNLLSSVEGDREDEAASLSRQLHDELGQRLTGLKMDVVWSKKRLDGTSEGLQEKFEAMLELINEMIFTVRSLSSNLRPPVMDLGLVAAAEWQAKEFQRMSGIPFTLIVEGEVPSMDEDREAATFRVLRQALMNVMEDPRATRVHLTIEMHDNALLLRIEDDRVGLSEGAESQARFLSMSGMQERVAAFGGALDMRDVGHGTRVSLSMPFDADGGLEERARGDALGLAEQDLRALTEGIADGLGVAVDGKVVLCNLAMADLVGSTVQQMLGTEALSYIHPDDRERGAERIRDVLTSGPVGVQEYRMVRADGKIFPVAASSSMIKYQGGQAAVTTIRDISDQKRREEALQLSETRLRESQRIAHVGSWGWEVEPDKAWGSDEVYRIFGIEPEGFEFTYESYMACVHPDDQATVADALDRALRDGAPFEMDLRIVRPDGTERIVHERGEVERDESGKAIRMLGTLQDVTEARRAEEAIQLSEARLQESQRIAHVGSWGLELDGNEAWWSEEVYRIFGIEPEGFEVTFESFLASVHPDDRTEVTEALAGAVEEGGAYQIEHRIVRPDGSERIVHERGEVERDESGQALRMLGTIQDLTEVRMAEEAVRKAEHRFRALFEGSPMAVVVVDVEEGRFVEFNQEVERLTGYSSEELSRLYPWDLDVDRPTREAVVPEIERAIRDGRRRIETRIRRKDGTLRHMVLWLSPLDAGGSHLLQVIMEDVTERTQAEDRARQSSEQLRALSVHLEKVREQERIDIARELHDEIGQAMTALQMDLAWLRRQEPPTGTIRERLDAMVALTESAIDAGRRISTRLRPGVLDDLGLPAAVDWAARDFAARSGLECEVQLGDSGSDLDAGTSTAFFRILQEALTNVMRHAKCRSVAIRLDLTGDPMLLEVEDDGRGVRSEELDDPRSLGILGMRERAAAVGGTVEIEGGARGGTTVRVSIPVLTGPS